MLIRIQVHNTYDLVLCKVIKITVKTQANNRQHQVENLQ